MPITAVHASGALKTDNTWVVYIPVYIPNFFFAWLSKIELATTEDIIETTDEGMDTHLFALTKIKN